MTWILTYSGKMFDIVNLTEDMIDPEDMIHALSFTPRWSGHSKKFYSVAAHCLRVAELVKEMFPESGNVGELAALLHDGPEAYIKDVARPIRPLLKGYDTIDNAILKTMCQKYNVPYPLPSYIWVADDIALATEKQDLMNTKKYDFPTKQKPRGKTKLISSRKAKYKMLLKFHKLANIKVGFWQRFYWHIRVFI